MGHLAAVIPGVAFLLLAARRAIRRARRKSIQHQHLNDSASTTHDTASTSTPSQYPLDSNFIPKEAKRSRGFPYELFTIFVLLLAVVLAFTRGSIALTVLCLLMLPLSWWLATSVKLVDTIVPTSQSEGALQPYLQPDSRLTGVWLKDSQRSDSLDPTCDAIHLHGLVRVAARLARGIELRLKTDEEGRGETILELAVFSIFPWFKIRERYELHGEPSYCPRRDLRRGKMRGTATVLPNGHLQLHLKWEDPFGGHGTDEFILMSDDELHVQSRMYVHGGISTKFNTVYWRKR